MVGTFPAAWEEVALVAIQLKGGTVRLFSAITETIDISEPDYPGESIMSIAGGRIWKQSGQEDGEVTLEMYPISIDQASDDQGLFQQFAGGTQDTSQPLATDTSWSVGTDRSRDRFIIAIMWTDDDTVNTAAEVLAPSGATGTDKVAIRFYAKECRITSHKASFTDGILKITATLKFPAFDAAGSTRSYAWESTNNIGGNPIADLSYS